MTPTLVATPLFENTSCTALPPEGAAVALGRPCGNRPRLPDPAPFLRFL